MPAPAKLDGPGNWFRICLGLVVGTAFIIVLFGQIDVSKVGVLFGRATVAPLLVALAAFVADFILRGVRFWVMLSAAAHRPLSLRNCIAPFIASFGISDILPLRAGDGFRVIWFRRRFGIPAGTIIGAMLVERLLDLIGLLTLGAIAVAIAGTSAPFALVVDFTLVLVVTLLGGATLLLAPALLAPWFARIEANGRMAPVRALLGVLQSTSVAVRHIGSWQRLIALTTLSLLCWILESFVFLGAWLSLGGSSGVMATPLLAFVFSTLGTLVPSLPGHFGSFEYFGVQAFTLAGVDTSFAAAVVLLAHLILWAPTAIFGVAWLLAGSNGRPRVANAPMPL